MPTSSSQAPPLDASTLGLDVEHIVETTARLHRRIEERFPGSSLGALSTRLLAIAERTGARLDHVAKPIPWLRVRSTPSAWPIPWCSSRSTTWRT